ncbi:adenylate/guanylate cyclase domain-containing protein [Jannaschia sp. CCS1]|uniref:adenylate/guanylate cyclase domain-containing protein n=1 Tax=Jannaschia sp. (strain CCS1) TaxID=290400 RepID=UPI000053C179|nr:adenylate/guanylate cyclase domain-containing protein [Jannaschia sp. CCS1]ABD54478.1 adenylate/guanylate cyclase [Jannaschia sp. CCS1]
MSSHAFAEKVRLPDWLSRYIDYGTQGLSGPELRQRRTLNVISALIPLSGLSYASLYLTTDAQGLWPAALAVSLFCIFAIWPFIAARSETAAWIFGAMMAVIVQAILVWLLGRASGLHLYFLSAPVIAIVCFGTRPVGRLIALALVCSVAMILSQNLLTAPASFIRVEDDLLTFLETSAFVIVTGFVTLGVYVGFLNADTAERALEVEYARSEDLLYSLLPREIAGRLKAEPHTTIADSLPNVAIVFADIANFTPLSARLDPRRVVDLLNGVFTEFDGLADRHQLEKIKTIGDAYMVAAGMPNSCGNPAHRAADMALDMLEVARATSVALPEGFEIRIGLHVGPVVAGVIGNRKLFYDVWGETVNTASRMETYSAPGRILITPAARAQLGEDFMFEPRGEIDVKGIGIVETWWLTDRI